MERMSWEEICRHEAYRGRWIALDQCAYDTESGRATAGSVVDADDDLVELCNRIQESQHRNCEILFCEPTGQAPVSKNDDEDPFRHTAH